MPKYIQGFAMETGSQEAGRVFSNQLLQWRWIYAIAAGLFILAATYHLRRFCFPQVGDVQGPIRHLTFVIVDSLLAIGLVWRPSWFINVYAAFAALQTFTHGWAVVSAIRSGPTLPSQDVFVLTGVLGILFLLTWEQRYRAVGQR